jgi:hypothetical protein
MKLGFFRPDSCMGCMFWLVMGFVFLLLLPLPSNLHAEQRISDARTEAYKLAEQLGYTSDDFLRSEVYKTNVDIITGVATCEVQLYFVTPLDLRTFEARLLSAQPGTRRTRPYPSGGADLSSTLPLSIDGVSGDVPGAEDKFQEISTVSWYLPGGRVMDKSVVKLHQIKQIPAKFTIGERRIYDNIAVIEWTAGRHPVWAVC